MKKTKKIITLMFVLAPLFFAGNNSTAQTTSQKGILTVNVKNIKSTKGKIVVNLFRKGDDIMGKPFIQLSGSISNGNAGIEIRDLSYSEYVVFVFHDENNNGTMDHNWLGIPNEPMGYSNNWNFTLFSGMPSYDKTKFTFSKELSVITITVK